MTDKQKEKPSLAPFEECTGCSACRSVCPQNCIVMTKDSYGFLHPIVDYTNCVNCKTCESVCPVINKTEPIVSKNLKAYAAYSLQDGIRKESSSGGVFSELAAQVLSYEGVVYGAAYDSNFSVHHICVHDKDDLWKLRGAKYSQSDLENSFYEVKYDLDLKKRVLFSGTPCQVAGLKTYLKKNYSNLLCVDFVCHGVASPEVWSQYVNYRANNDNEGVSPEFINLRNKDSGWSNYKYSVHFRYSNGLNYKGINGQDEFTRLYSSNSIINIPCSSCKFKGSDRASDITIGDFWGIWDMYPEIDNRFGVSLIVCNSNQGNEYLQMIRDRLFLKEITIEEAIASNPSYYESIGFGKHKDQILKLSSEGKISEAISMLNSIESNSQQNLTRRMVGRLKSAILKRVNK